MSSNEKSIENLQEAMSKITIKTLLNVCHIADCLKNIKIKLGGLVN